MQWKLWRGKDRPMLMSLVRQNSDASVIAISTASFKLAVQHKWKEALTKLAELRGVGPATASAILAALYPEDFVFMADEVIEAATSKKREYTMKAYEGIINCIQAKQKILGDQEWCPAKIGKAMWCAGVLGLSVASDVVDEPAAPEETGRKRKRR
jgi:hypothetical protein